MDKMVVTGGKVLKGSVAASGAKNAALPLIFATLLAEGTHQLKNVPALMDIDSSRALMESLGCSTEFSKNELIIKVKEKLETLAHYEQVRKMRASILVLGPLLARFGEAKVSLPGGCAIGARPIGFHLDALAKMGATIEVTGGYVIAKAKKLKGTKIEFSFATVGGTENIMMAAALAEGTTEIHNAAREPEIEDLANYINKMGGQVEGAGTSVITIHGSEKLKAASHSVIPDRIEVGTLIAAGAMTAGEVTVTDCSPKHLEAFLSVIQKIGHKIETDGSSITVTGQKSLIPTEVETLPHPGFPTDLQAQTMALLTQVDGVSKITETVFENRFMHVSELARLGADIKIDGKMATIFGSTKMMVAAPVMATDLRASASLVLAGLVAQGETVVSRIYHLDRGYENLEFKISKLGGNIRRVKSDS